MIPNIWHLPFFLSALFKVFQMTVDINKNKILHQFFKNAIEKHFVIKDLRLPVESVHA